MLKTIKEYKKEYPDKTYAELRKDLKGKKKIQHLCKECCPNSLYCLNNDKCWQWN